jgi:methionyl-tRNA formyltransferase
MKIVVISAPHMIHAPRILGRLFREMNHSLEALVLIEPRATKLARSVIQRAGVRYFLLRAAELQFTKLQNRLSRSSGSLEAMANRHKIEVIRTRNVNGKETREQIAGRRPDVILSVFAPQIFKDPLIEIPSVAILNLHPSLLPAYAGIAPVFWCMANGENETGVTLHHISKKVDEGDIFLQRKISISPDDTVRSLYLKACDVGSRLLIDACRMLIAGDTPRTEQDLSAKSYFGNPDREAYKQLRKKGRRLF